MQIQATQFEGVYLIQCFRAKDERGAFTKIFNEDDYVNEKIPTKLKETYYSISKKDVIRGMHFQMPPHEHEKIVHVIKGSVVDVILDLRKESKTYRQWMELILREEDATALYIPKGFAHGFKSLKDDTVMLYQVSSGYNKECDTGVAYDSIGYDWGIEKPIISARDREFVPLSDFSSPF